jgi:AraC-like DNA-binding protein
MIHVTELLRALIMEFARMTPLYRKDSSEERLVMLLLDHIRPSHTLPVVVPKANDPRLRTIMDHLLVTPQDSRTLSDWAEFLGVSEKTLTRGFLKETNMSFRKWRQQARLLKALELLADAQPVTSVAMEVGYESTSAFITMFKEACGVLPSSYYTSPPLS